MADDGLKAVFLADRALLLRLLAARLRDADEAEDALQDMWFRISALEDRPVANASAYLYRMATNLATDRRIAATRRGTLESAWSEVQPGTAEFPSAERTLIARDRLRQAEVVLESMPERMRAAYRMFRIDELPQRSIAERLGISLSGVEKLLARAYRQLHDMNTMPDGGEAPDAR